MNLIFTIIKLFKKNLHLKNEEEEFPYEINYLYEKDKEDNNNTLFDNDNFKLFNTKEKKLYLLGYNEYDCFSFKSHRLGIFELCISEKKNKKIASFTECIDFKYNYKEYKLYLLSSDTFWIYDFSEVENDCYFYTEEINFTHHKKLPLLNDYILIFDVHIIYRKILALFIYLYFSQNN